MRVRGWLIGTMVAIAAGLGIAGPTVAKPPDPAVPPSPVIADGSAQKALDAARARWKAAGVHSYRMRVVPHCFCPPAPTPTITVRAGKPIHPPPNVVTVATVPRLFREIQRDITGKVASFTVTYGAYGVPALIAIDPSLQVVDEQYGYTVDRFTPLPPAHHAHGA